MGHIGVNIDLIITYFFVMGVEICQVNFEKFLKFTITQ